MFIRSLIVAGVWAAHCSWVPELSTATGVSVGQKATPNLKIVDKGFVSKKTISAIAGVCRCRNGDLLVAYNTNTDISAGQRFALVRSSDGGKTWAKPETFFESIFQKGGVEAAGSLTRLANGRLLLPYADGFYLYPEKNYDRHVLLFCPTSDDNGKTWKNTKAVCFPALAAFAFGKIVELPGGALLLPLWGSYDKHGEIVSGVLKSKDGDNSWTDWRPITRRNGSETPVVLLPDKRLVALLRQYTDDKDRPFHISYSKDGGDTWTIPLKVNLNGEAPGLHVTPKGLLLAGYRTLNSRCHISSSRDGGRTWKFEVQLEGPREREIGEYPSFENLPDGRILVVYDDGKPSWHLVYNILQEP